MARNLISLDDVKWAATRLPSRVSTVARRVVSPRKQRTIASFTKDARSDQWWAIPLVRERWNKMISGDREIDHYRYLADSYLTNGGLVGLSVGCGDGSRELAWAKTGRFDRLLGVDLTPSQVERARERAEHAGFAHVLDFQVADLTRPGSLGDEKFDVIIGEHSVHHLSPLEIILRSLATYLTEGGYVFLDEFVGPTRFQWTDVQLDATNAMLATIPARLRERLDGTLKERVRRPSLLRMQLTDPSEAVESSRILPLMDEIFERVEIRPYGGTVLHLLLSGIAHNFVEPSGDAKRLLEAMFAAEDALLDMGLPSDFVVAVYRSRP